MLIRFPNIIVLHFNTRLWPRAQAGTTAVEEVPALAQPQIQMQGAAMPCAEICRNPLTRTIDAGADCAAQAYHTPLMYSWHLEDPLHLSSKAGEHVLF